MSSKRPLTFQDVILALQRYWADQGCVLWQPYHTEVGAGTMNPATVLRVLGPEPWRVAYVEPSIRPADGRYGENPNRWQHFYQFQVILKPDPGDPQEIYLRSLVALGIDPAEHDIRFVEDNWEAPALGAWGLGWEVWLDGQEITQYTYFQQSGGQVLDPVSVEITYGLERILVALQGVDTFLDVAWNDSLNYGQLNLQAEREYCRYNFEAADVPRLRTVFDEFEAEARACLAAGLVLPAHDYVLKCSHTFNLLDARGAVGVAERAALFGRMRDLSRRVAEAYLAQRESLAFPWGRVEPKSAVWEAAPADEAPAPLGPAPFVLEIGTEELPAADLASALEQLRESVPAMLEEARLAHGAIRVLGTPRRLVLQVEGLAPSQTEQVSEVKGPPADKAFDAEGRPTAAAQGFARSKGVAVEALRVEEVDGGRYTVAQVRQAGRTADAVLAERIPPLFEGLAFDRSMRWDGGGMVFSRPIRWLLALHGGHVVPISLAGLRAGRTTRGLRFLDPECLTVGDVEAYFAALRPQGILLDPEERSRQIKEQVDVLAGAVGGKVPDDPELQEEVTNLVEAPTALRGAFDAAYLSLPRQVLVSVLKKHQRCFAVERGGTLLPYFVSVRNGGRHHLETVAHGNEQVVRARFADAAYFVRRDLERPLEAYLPRLATLTFQAQLGSVLEKVGRVERLVDALAASLGLTPDDARVARRAAHLCKADLATNMVVEMTSLQGVMGREYALRSGEPPEVAQAIDEHYQPRHAGDSVPASRPGVAVGLADRLDTLMALFAAGLQPTGTRDPFALRRAAIGLVQILIAHQIRLDLRRSLAMAAEGLPIPAPAAADQACLDFIATRQQALLLAEGHRYDAVEAVLAAQSHDPAGAAQAVPALEAWVGRDDWAQTLQAYARCVRITRDQTEVHAVEPQRFIEEAERELHAALEGAQAGARAPGSVDDFLNAFRPMVPAITRFFDDVLVMAEDERLRLNRLGLLQRIVALASGVADLSRMEGF